MRLMVASDLDGTLLDHATYSWAPAEPALAALRAARVPLVLATSKTAAEVRPLHAALSLGDTPAIVENGAGILWPGRDGEEDDSAWRELRAALGRLPDALRAPFEGFGDMSVTRLRAVTRLPPGDAARAKQRQHSEPGLWHGDDAGRAAFVAALGAQGVAARPGGRFLTLSAGRTKADAVAEVARHLGARRVLALGDAPNDAEMLEAADIGIVVRNDHGTPLPPLRAKTGGQVRRTDLTGPAGWNAAVLDVLAELGIERD